MTLDRAAHLRERRSVERSPAVEALPRDHAKRELIAARIDVGAGELLGRHVRGRPHHRADRRGLERCRGRRRRIGSDLDDPREPEVRNARSIVVADQHVLRLEVAMHDPGGVRRGQTAPGVDQHRDDRAPRSSRRREPHTQRRAAHVLHRDVGRAIDRPDLEHVDDIRMRELRHRDRLALQANVAGARAMNLECDVAIERDVARQVHRSHATATEQRRDLVALVDRRSDDAVGIAINLTQRRLSLIRSERERHDGPTALALVEVTVERGARIRSDQSIDQRRQRVVIGAIHDLADQLHRARGDGHRDQRDRRRRCEVADRICNGRVKRVCNDLRQHLAH